ncbi:B-4DMT family transporter [Gordonia sp. PDNC005]|uniref:B-4DMT family transporter n=1 Tax=unclassified Gordonia (in: high G+C Gram-positive bacteria) TaxID=2657482 RepID=UPI001962CFDE|nr:B-4DMT family transporter [Gordonia sp. PDNC005]QRY64021.1 B-4DMT family transporter [Gordonia sp. PDNC005]
MSSWLLRGVVMSIVHIAARIILGAVVISAPLSSPLARWLTIAACIVVAIVWGGLDGLKDARAHSDPDDYEDLTVRWLKAGLLAGFVSCLVSWILGTVWLNGIGQASLPIELIAGTSFIALIVFVPAFFGASVGRFLIRREQRKAELASEEAAEANTQHAVPTA